MAVPDHAASLFMLKSSNAPRMHGKPGPDALIDGPHPIPTISR
jgi:hypothetical protein